MTAQSIKSGTKRTRPRPNPTEKQLAILKIKKDHPKLNTIETGKLANCNHSTVVRTLAKYKINHSDVIEYRNNEVDILTGFRHRIVRSCTDEDIKKAPFGSRILALAQLIDKERVLTGGNPTAKPLITINIQAGPGMQPAIDITPQVEAITD